MELSIQIKKYRTELHLSQEELAEKVYVTRQTISNWENEKSYPDLQILIAMSNQFDVSLDTLLKGDSKMVKAIDKERVLGKIKYEKSLVDSLRVLVQDLLPLASSRQRQQLGL